MTPSALADLSDDELDRRWLAHYDASPLFRYMEGKPGGGGMTPGQEAFHRATGRRRCLRAANQIGKSYAGAAEAWWHAIGAHPYREVAPGPNEGWIVLCDLDNDWPKVSANLRKLEQSGALDPACKYDSLKGYTYGGARRVKLRNGSTMLPKSGTQQQTALAGASIAWIWFDEPPRQSHWGEALTRVSVSGGDAWLTFTPIGKPLAWLKEYFYGNAETGEAGHPEWLPEIVVTLTAANCPHRTPENIAAQIAEYGPWEMAQRVFGEWEGVTTGRRFRAFGEGCVIDDDGMPAEIDQLRLGLDHGEGIGKQIGYLSGITGKRVVVLRECLPCDEAGRVVESPTPHDAARGILRALTSLGLTVHAITRAFGDVNSAGLTGGGGKYNAFIEAAMCDLLRTSKLPFEIEIPAKGRGSVGSGESAMNSAMRDGRYLVHRSCVRGIHALRHYTGREADLKDPIDGQRYAVADVLLATRGGASPMVLTL